MNKSYQTRYISKNMIKFILHGFFGKKEVKRFYDDIAEIYESAMKDQQKGVERIMENLPTGEIGLDLGCGTGLSTLELMAKTDKAVGVDFSRGMLSEAKKKNLPYLINADISRLPFKDISFDTSAAIGVLRHLSRKQEGLFFKELYRVLKKEGVFLTPAADYSFLDKFQCLAYDLFMQLLGYSERLGSHSLENLTYQGRKAGFSYICKLKLEGYKKSFLVYFVK